MKKAAIPVFVAILMSGCVSMQKYESAMKDIESQTQARQHAEDDRDAAVRERDDLWREKVALEASVDGYGHEVASLEQQVALLERQREQQEAQHDKEVERVLELLKAELTRTKTRTNGNALHELAKWIVAGGQVQISGGGVKLTGVGQCPN
jgi:predicted  nucleic acid-binding Zn-ribbon protein